ncbi:MULTISPECIES: hypothetical protein [unclassified Chryseobacterium]|uniref:hypothetical protein n=1 Tax=unclassified Chryseobacterium TaxID=2593645 RepID=UPI0022698BA2|nr:MULTISPECIES: hypothetical protein [unclassified Chryseobacterium]
MLEKDEKRIKDELSKLIKDKLLSEYKDVKEKPVDSVEYIEIISLDYDTENQDRKKIIVKKVIANVRLHILFMEGSTSSLNTQFKNNKPIDFTIDFSEDEVNLVESDVKFIEEKLF